MTREPDDYGDGFVASPLPPIAFDVGRVGRVDPSIIECPPGFGIVPETGEGIPAANEYPFGSFRAWTAALAVKP